MSTTAHPELDGLGTYEFGWHDKDAAGNVRPARPVRGGGSRHLGEEERAGVDARLPAQGAPALRQEADAHLGLRPHRH